MVALGVFLVGEADPHGSSAAMTGITDGAGLPGETSATDSALLRLENRGICEVCHQK